MRVVLVPLVAILAGPIQAQDSPIPAEVEAYVRMLSDFSERISDGLPPELPAHYGVEDFLDFERIEGLRRPVASQITFDGARPDPARLDAVLRDEHGILLPPGGRIRRLSPDTPDESWEYPAGTRLTHRFYWADTASTVFELRLIERRADGRWAFGSYLRTADGKLRLLQRQETAAFALELEGRAVQVALTRLPPESCRRCHAAASPNRYRDVERAGPCGFGPANAALLRGWADRFRAARGYEPFE
ncbi:MAG: hypothetical protein HY553_01930 [Elusimicrobia bacterium]|nr:hypothetical protein [Elusimicrobiota bacterium]